MKSITAIYELQPITDDPRYDGFGFEREDSLRGKLTLSYDFMPDDIPSKGRDWTVTRLAPFWEPQTVEGRVRLFNDYPCVNLSVPAFSRRAVDALRDFIEPNGELLPLKSKVGEYFAYNVTTVADILDLKRSKVDWLDEVRGIADTIDFYEFDESKLCGLSIFRLVEEPSSTFVADVFVERVTSNYLNGFNFIKVWPFPKGVNWQQEERQRRRKLLQVKTKRGIKKIKGNTVVIGLSLMRSNASKGEKKRIAEIEDELDTLLVEQEAAAMYYGNLEGNDQIRGECRLFISCPDADALIDKLRPWLTDLQWEGQVTVLKRYGEFVDPDAPEEIVEV